MNADDRISITICGDGGCGKSSITLRLVRSQWTHEYDPTIEDSYSVTRHVDGHPYALSIIDTAGQEEYRSLFASTSMKSDAFLLVYDITSSSTLQALDTFHAMVDAETEIRRDDGKVPPIMIVAGNKCDLAEMRKVSAQEGLRWARERGCGFMETSARECVNIEETFALLVRRVIAARRQQSAQPSPTKSTRSSKSSKSTKAPTQIQHPPPLPSQFHSSTYPTSTGGTSPTKSRYTTTSPSPLQQEQFSPVHDEKVEWPMPPAREISVSTTTPREMSVSAPGQQGSYGSFDAGAGAGGQNCVGKYGVPTLFPPPPGKAKEHKKGGKWWRWMLCWR